MKKVMYGKRFIALLTGMVLTFLSLPLYTGSAKEESTVRQVNNIVLFAQFDSLEDKNFMESSTDTVQTMCNDDTTYRSLSKYVDTMIKGLDYAWEHARDQAGLMYHDWTGRTDEKRKPKWLLDASCVPEYYARVAMIKGEVTNRKINK